jgi:hypothetical protein
LSSRVLAVALAAGPDFESFSRVVLGTFHRVLTVFQLGAVLIQNRIQFDSARFDFGESNRCQFRSATSVLGQGRFQTFGCGIPEGAQPFIVGRRFFILRHQSHLRAVV